MSNFLDLSGGRKKLISRPYSTRELAAIYGVCPNTFRNWIAPFKAELGPRIGRFYTVTQVNMIFSRLSYPSTLDWDDEGETGKK